MRCCSGLPSHATQAGLGPIDPCAWHNRQSETVFVERFIRHRREQLARHDALESMLNVIVKRGGDVGVVDADEDVARLDKATA